MSYIGNGPGVASQRVLTQFTATAGQTVFVPSSGYTVGYIDVYQNGAKLVDGVDYTANDGVSFTLTQAATDTDSFECLAHFPRGLSDGYMKSESDAKYLALAGGTLTGNLTLSGGTANGVAYLNGSKVLTTGTALTFDGTNLSVGTSSHPSTLAVYAATGGSTTGLTVNASGNMLNLFGSSSTNAGVIFDATDGTVGSATGVPMIYRLGGSEQMRLTSTGLGIGTSSPQDILDINSPAGTAAIRIATQGVGSLTWRIASQLVGVANAGFAIRDETNAVNRLVIDGSGNVGIGTSSPGYRLDTLLGAGSGNIFRAGQSGVSNGYTISTNGSALTHIWANGGSDAMRLDSSGNLGLGVTPSAGWDSNGFVSMAFKNAGNSISSNSASYFEFAQNAVWNAGWKYANTAAATRYEQGTGIHAWYTAASGTAGNAISFTQAMTLDASGNLLVGGTSVYGATITSYASASRSGGLGIRNSAGTVAGGIYTGAAGSGGGSTDVYVEGAGLLGFITNGSERARIDTSGRLLINTTSGTGTTGTVIYNYGGSSTPWNNNAGAFWSASGNIGLTSAYASFNFPATATTDSTAPWWMTGSVAGSGNGFIINLRSGWNGSSGGGDARAYRIINGGTATFATVTGHEWMVGATTTPCMVLNSSGCLGIGTNSPQFSVHSTGHFALTNASSGTDGGADALRNGIGWSATGGSQVLGALITAQNQGNWGADIQFYTRGSSGGTASEKARLTYDGKLLVGRTGTEASGAKVQIAGSGVLSSTTVTRAQTSGLYLNETSGTANYGVGVWFDHGSLMAGIASSRVNTGNWGTDLRFYTHPDATSNSGETYERARITSGGQFLVNTTTTSGGEIARFESGSNTSVGIIGSGTGSCYLNFGDADPNVGFIAYNHSTDSMSFRTAGVNDRVTLDSNGSLLVGTASNAQPNVAAVQLLPGSGAYSGIVRILHSTTNVSGSGFSDFWYNGTNIGSISQSGTTAVAYNTSSDYRLKNNQQPLTGSGEFIDALQPKTWEWKTDGSKGVGFIAHEVQAVSPGSVVGEKDAVDAEGKPKYQAMEYGSAEFIANIVAELQSLRKRVAALESK